MKHFLLAFAILTGLVAGAVEATASLEVTPVASSKYNVTIKDDEYAISCNITGKGLSEKDLLTVQAEGEGELRVTTNTETEQVHEFKNGVTLSGFYKTGTTEGDKSFYHVTLNFSPKKVGKLTIKCLDTSREFRVINVIRTATEGNLSCEFEIPKEVLSSISDFDEKLLSVKLTRRGEVPEGLTSSPNCSMNAESDEQTLRVCLNNEPTGQQSLKSGQYQFALRYQEETIAVAYQALNSEEIKITNCMNPTGSNCIADSPTCHFKCDVEGWPFSDCWALGPANTNNKDPKVDRVQVTCVPDEHIIKIVLQTPVQEDSGKYIVNATGGSKGQSSEGDLTIRVKDKLAPLWPFLGICAEVVVLCGIILFFEKRHQKKLQQQEQEGDATEPMVKNPGKGGDVRQRTAKA